MDTRVLLNLIDDLVKEETKHNLNSKIAELISGLTQSRQSDASNSDIINSLVTQIKTFNKESFTNLLTRSQTKVFEAIEGHEYFGTNLNYRIDDILSDNQYNLQKIIVELQKIMSEREKFIANITSIQEKLTDLGIEPHYFTEEIYEVGVIIPDTKNLHDAPVIEKQIHNWNFVLKTLNELTGNEVQDIKIDRVSDGCIELFFQQAFEVAEAIGTALTKIAVIYVTIREIKKHREGLKQLKVPASETKAIEEHEKKLIDTGIDEATDEIVKKHSKKADPQRKNELKTAVNKSIRFIARSIDNGIEVEIIPPYLGSDDEDDTDVPETEATKKSKEQKEVELKKKEERIEIIKKSGSILRDVTEVGNGVLKLLTGGDDKLEAK